jgi:c-di-GMP-binding flagellar brake protein YcgR
MASEGNAAGDSGAEAGQANFLPSNLSEQKDRRAEPRYPVEARAVMLLVRSATAMQGKVLDLSVGGCQLRTEQKFTLGIFSRIEVEFHVRGLAFRLQGVTQSIHDQHTLGVRFLDVSERRREQLLELIAELAETAEAAS